MPGPATISKSISGFDPRSVPGCQLWLDAADSSSITGSSPVTAWRDKSVNGYSGTSSGSPTLVSASQNGLSCVSFTAASSQYFNFGTGIPLLSTGITVFAVGKTTFGASAQTIVAKSRAYGTIGRWALLYESPYLEFLIDVTGSGVLAQSSPTSYSGVFSLFEGSWISPTSYLYANGTQIGSVSASGTPSSITDLVLVGAYPSSTGSTPPTSGYYYNGTIGEIIVYNTKLSTSQRQAIEGYLAWKWGIESVSTKNLITTHPFYYNRVFSRPFQPVDIPGCMIWLDGADTTTKTPTIPSSGTSITAWQDKACLMYSTGTIAYSFTPGAIQKASSNGTVYTEASPTYVTGGGLLFSNSTGLLGNGQQGLGLYSSNVNSSPLFTMPTQAMTIAIASYPLSNNSYRRLAALGSYQLGGAYLPNFFFGPEMGTSEGGTLLYDFNGSAWGQANYGTTGYNSNAALRVDVMISSPGASQWWWTNGTLNTFNTSNVYTSAYSNYPVNFFLIGSYTNTIDGNRNFHGNIYEVLLYNTALTISQRQQVEGYLAWKWGFRTSLIAGHPYGTIPPSSALPFTPTSITGCALWLDGLDQSTLNSGTITNGGTVTSWLDKSGNGYTCTVAVNCNAVGPVYNSTTNSLQFVAGNSNALATPQAFGNLLISTTFTFVIVGQRTVSTGYSHFLSGQALAANQTIQIGFSNNYMETAGYGPLLDTAITAYSSPDPIRIYGYDINSTNYDHVLNGTLLNAGITGGTSLLTAFTVPEIGRRYGNTPTVTYHSFNLFEMIAYKPALTTTQRQRVEGYLAWKWGLQTSLPSSHPYYKINPVQGYLT